MLDKAIELDINRGGLWDARSGAINLWCSPTDKPRGWENVKIDKCALNYPRSFVASFYVEFLEVEERTEMRDIDLIELAKFTGWVFTYPVQRLEGLVRIHLVIAPYDKMRQIHGKLHDRPEKYVSEEDKEWCLEKWEELKEAVLSGE